jgi:GTP-binding protein LepA
MEFGLTVVPVINKIDLPSADVDRVMEEIDRDLGLDPFASIQVSAKLGTGVDDLLEAIVQHLPAPKGDPKEPLRALLFDAQYDAYRGAVLLVRLFDGALRAGTRVRFMHSGQEHKVEEVGYQRLKHVPAPELSAGEVGYVLAGVKSLSGLAIGDTLTEAERPAAEKDCSAALGFGFRCGFLGLLHLDVVQERLEREYAGQPPIALASRSSSIDAYTDTRYV